MGGSCQKMGMYNKSKHRVNYSGERPRRRKQIKMAFWNNVDNNRASTRTEECSGSSKICIAWQIGNDKIPLSRDYYRLSTSWFLQVYTSLPSLLRNIHSFWRSFPEPTVSFISGLSIPSVSLPSRIASLYIDPTCTDMDQHDSNTLLIRFPQGPCTPEPIA